MFRHTQCSVSNKFIVLEGYFLLNSMALMVDISNSWVYGLPIEKNFILFLKKGATKLPMPVDQWVSMSGGQLSVFLKKDS